MSGDKAQPIDPDSAGDVNGDSRPAERETDARHSIDDHSPDIPVCDLCGSAMVELHCKIVCPRCGYVRDCSDP